MLNGLLANNLGDGAFYAVFGFLFVFLGIALLVAFFTVLGVFMKKWNARRPKKKKIKSKESAPSEERGEREEIFPEVVAAITAAVAAVLEGENAKCDFVVKRIKRL